MSRKFLIVGYGRHGKDTVAEIMRDNYGLTFASSSWVAAEKVCRPWLVKQGIVYSTLEACYADRSNHRAAWHDAICDYNKVDRARLCREILKHNDIYVGMRCPLEFAASRALLDLIIWVDACNRKPKEDQSSCKVEPGDADIIIDNSGTVEQLEPRVCRLMNAVLRQ